MSLFTNLPRDLEITLNALSVLFVFPLLRGVFQVSSSDQSHTLMNHYQLNTVLWRSNAEYFYTFHIIWLFRHLLKIKTNCNI